MSFIDRFLDPLGWHSGVHKEVWGALVSKINSGGILNAELVEDRVVAKFGPWRITLDAFVWSTDGYSRRISTRIRVLYVRKDGLKFAIYRSGALGKKPFVISSNNEAKERELLSDPSIPMLIAKLRFVELEAKPGSGWFSPYPKGINLLYFAQDGLLLDVEMLHGVFDLYAAILRQLVKIGSAEERDPGVELS
jgi:hypothetical protein